jgi:hypothetical protein
MSASGFPAGVENLAPLIDIVNKAPRGVLKRDRIRTGGTDMLVYQINANYIQLCRLQMIAVR